ncbi:MAG: phosphatase PAP2 family protein [Tissierellia bacterium]|nr:phosphatase PAP2 family protein [Tissierellia bacterium]
MKKEYLPSWTKWDTVCVAMVLIFGLLVFKSGGFMWEKIILAHTTSSPEGILKIMKVFSLIGDPMGYIILWIPLIGLIAIKNKRVAVFLALAIILPAIFESIIKIMVQRNRPLEFMLIDQGGFSYPSGHSTTGLSAYFMLGQFLTVSWAEKILRSIGIVIGISRLFLGVHWPTDVLMGFILGYIIYRQLRRQFYKRTEKVIQ